MCTSVANCHSVERSDAAVHTFCVENFRFNNFFRQHRLRAAIIKIAFRRSLRAIRINTFGYELAVLLLSYWIKMGFFSLYVMWKWIKKCEYADWIVRSIELAMCVEDPWYDADEKWTTVNRCTIKVILPINLPLLSFALYFCDRTPSILMLHIEINGDQACLPWMMSNSSASWISLTILSRDAVRFESLCCLSSIENDNALNQMNFFT